MYPTSKQFRSYSQLSLRHQWAPAVIATFIINAIVVFPNLTWKECSWTPLLLLLLISFPLSWGYQILFLRNIREKRMDLKVLISGYPDFFRITGTVFLQAIYSYLWSLLLILPGIIKSYSYAMTPYILHDDPEIQYDYAIEKSMAMMKGSKKRLFCLDLSFIGWYLLGIVTVIGMLWVYPYHMAARAAFYEDLKNNFSQM